MSTITYTTQHGFTLAGTEQGAWMDNIDPLIDLSGSSKPLTQIGTITKSAVNVGSEAFQYS